MRYREIAIRSTLAAALAALALVGANSTAFGQTPAPGCEDRPGRIDWDGGGGTGAWNEPTNWAGDTLPGPGSHACIALAGAAVVIDAGTASLASLQVAPGSSLTITGSAVMELVGPEPSTIATLGLYAGTLTGGGTRTITGSAVLDAGTLTGNGRTVIAPGAQLQTGSGGGGTLAINGGHVLAIEAGASGLWGPGPHDITLDAPSRIENAGELDITNDRTLGGSGTLANTGTLRKLSHGTTTLHLVLDNDGQLAIDGGLVDAAGGDGGLSSDGALSVAARSRLRLRDGTTTLGASAALGGPGELEVTTGASLTVPPTATYDIATSYLTGGTLDLEGDRSLATLGLYAGTLTGGGTRTITGSAVLDAGTLTGNGRTVIAPGAQLQTGSGGGGTLAINGGHVLAIEAGASGLWGPGPHDITLDAPSRIENAGELDITNDRTLGGSGTLANTGTLRKLSHGTTTLHLVLDNDGQLAIDGGLVDAAGGDGGLSSDGALSVAARSRLRLRDGTTTLGASAALGGPGELEVTTGASLTVPPTATYDIATSYLTGGTLDLEGDRSLATLGLYAGTLTGGGTRTITGSAVLDAGTLTGNGRTVIAPGAQLQTGSGGGGTLAINGGHVLAIEAGASGLWGPGPHDITLDAPSRIENAGELDITNDRTLGGSGTLANTGTLRKLSHGTTTLHLVLDNDGQLAIDGGLVDAAGGDGGLSSDGALSVAARSRLRLRDGTTTLGASAALGGPGELEVTTGASLTVPPTATYDIATSYLTGGTLDLEGDRSLATLGLYAGTLTGGGTRTITGSAVLDAGTLTGNGRTVIAPGAQLQTGSGGGGTLAINGGHVLAIEAGASGLWGPGPHDITLDAPSRIENAGELDITNDRTLGGSGTLANTGTLRKLSHGTTTLHLVLDNDGLFVNGGTLDVEAGVLSLDASGLENQGVLHLGSSVAQTGQLRTTTFRQTATGSLELGLSGVTPAARAGTVVVSGALAELGGGLTLVPDPRFQATASQRLVLLSAPAPPTGELATVTGTDQLPGGQPAHVLIAADGLVLVIGIPAN